MKRTIETERETVVLIGKSAKIVKHTILERIGRAVVAGATEPEIDAIRRAEQP
ncbi:hypothetical protein [Mesorhizobium sp. 128a]